MVSPSSMRLSPSQSIIIRAMKRPIKALWKRSNSFQSQQIHTFGSVASSLDVAIPDFDDIPALEDDFDMDLLPPIQVPKTKKRSMKVSVEMQSCNNDHPLMNIMDSAQSKSQYTDEDTTEVAGLQRQMRHVEPTNNERAANERITNERKRPKVARHSEHIPISLQNRTEPQSTIQEELVLFSIKTVPLTTASSRHFNLENSSFLRMYAAEKKMLDHGKIVRFTCSPWKQATARHTDKPEEILGIVVRWPKTRHSRRVWNLETL